MLYYNIWRGRIWAGVTMNWVRGEAKRLSLLALFALAIQFGFSFGHIHADAWSRPHQQTVKVASSASPVGTKASSFG